MARPTDAASAYETALSRRPASPLIQLNLGRSLMAAGGEQNLAKAVDFLAAAQKAEPNWAFLHRQYGIALGKSGRIAEADLALANEAILTGDRQRATQLAKRVLARDDVGEVLRNRASDILFRYGRDAE